MTPGKRLFDIAVALFLGAVLILPFGMLLIVVLLRQGRPVFYVSERMRAPGQPFLLWKLRTMRDVASDSGVSGGDKAARVTPMGRWLRKHRADEIPQLWNVLKGDMSFVGPRPPLRSYVERYPQIYARVLQSRPGITGLATLCFHQHEERILSTCQTPEQTEAAYVRRCIPRKARLDEIYRKHRTICMDFMLMVQTARGAPRRGKKRKG
ncbi:sugar transferase [Pseudotabrizicola sediminis]|uniref:Sugar transferase n=1 Tax=Pseudotabrizicola sediminis TaxID=2486418 RepID=A0ABY2KL22_9RHOB|nr:sugar transferase [Pseudotabrizicola sediminis]TGD43206.1 sugar transferase [Pseudotabrizicola sediminis]